MKPEGRGRDNVAEMDGGLRKHSGANLRLFLTAGWLLAEGWLTRITCCTRKAEILKAEQVEKSLMGVKFQLQY